LTTSVDRLHVTHSAGTKWAEVDVAALRDNTRALHDLVGDSCSVMAMVKANGYGHGAVVAARSAIAGGATWLGVSSIREALELRRAGLTAAILNVGWTPEDEMSAAASADIDISVFDPDGVAAAKRAAGSAGRPLRVHWKIDTGMGRLGTSLDALEATRDALRHAGGDVLVAGLFTHFASADAESLAFTARQHDRFTQIATSLRDLFPDALLHAANSAALLRLSETRHDIVRPGIALYGYLPSHSSGVVSVRPALRVRAVVTQVKRVAPGDTVGYGREWTPARASRVATLAAGYADGIDRRNGNNGNVLLGGTLCPIVGRISMDQLSIDVSDAGDVAAGDVATVIGSTGEESVDAAAIAARIGTIPNEVLCAVSARVPRVTTHAQDVCQ
jgi:alanine racemase